MNTQDDLVLSTWFRALGDPTRLRIFRFLCLADKSVALGGAGEVRPVEGTTIGDVCCHVTGCETVNSTISHHVRELRLAGLIQVDRKGKYMVCSVNREALNELHQLIGASLQECCSKKQPEE